MPRKSRNQMKWEQLAPECIETGVSDWKTVDEIKGAEMKWTKNGGRHHSMTASKSMADFWAPRPALVDAQIR